MDVVGVFIPGLPGPVRAGGGSPTSQEFNLVYGGVWDHDYRAWGRRGGGGPTSQEFDLRCEDIVGDGGGEGRRDKCVGSVGVWETGKLNLGADRGYLI